MKLQKNNGNKEEWQLPDEAILCAFRWSNEWGEHLAGVPFEKALRKFISSENGLASSFDGEEFVALMARRGEVTDYTEKEANKKG